MRKKTYETPSESTQNACCLRRSFTTMCCLPGKNALRKNAYYLKFRAPSFLQCFFYHLRHGRQKKMMSQGARNQGFWDLLAHFEVQEARNFWFGMRHKIAGFYLVLSVSVVPSVSVESAMESNDASHDVPSHCIFERHTSKSHDLCSKKPPLPPLRCRLRQTQRGRDFLGGEASGRHALHGETLLCGSHHVVTRLEITCDLKENLACGACICHQVGHVRQWSIWKKVLIFFAKFYNRVLF